MEEENQGARKKPSKQVVIGLTLFPSKRNVSQTRSVVCNKKISNMGLTSGLRYKLKRSVSSPKCQISPDAPGADLSHCGAISVTAGAKRPNQK